MEENQKQIKQKSGLPLKHALGPANEKSGVYAAWSTGRAILAAAILLLTGLALWFHRTTLLWEETEQGSPVFCTEFAVVLGGVTLCSVLLCFLELSLPKWAERVGGWIAALLLPLGAFFAVDLINGTRILTFSPLRGFANYLCYLMIFALAYVLCRRVWLTALIGGGACLLFGIANYFVIQFRGQPILPWDISAAATALEVSGGYQYRLTREMVLSLAMLVFAVLLCFRLFPGRKERSTRRGRLLERACALLLSLTLGVLIFPMNLLSHMDISVWPWNQKVSAELTGVMTGFFANIQFLLVEKPEGYSMEAVKELGDKLDSAEEPAPLGNPDGLPTIIVVMNESMTDFQSVGELDFAPDNLPFIHSLQGSGDVIWGTAYSSVYGGNTCNSEYEFLTGNTTAFLPTGSKPYQQYVDHEQTALPSILKSYGYSCTAIHPGNRAAWQRDKAYPHLGFDEFISARSFDVRRDLIHGLTSDASHYDQVIYEYEHRDREQPQFLFTVTIQNHGGYEDNTVPVTVRIRQEKTEGVSTGYVAYPQTEQYLSLTKLSDQAFEDFIGYFEEQEDPVVVLFFGDHWPNLETGFLSSLLGADANNLSFEDQMREYQVPFLIWANYPLEGQHVEEISLNYLSGLLLQAAGLEGTDYTKYLENLRQQLPVITDMGTRDRDGNWYKNGDETPYDELLNEYAILQYNNAFGKEEKVRSVFERQPEG